MKEKKFWLDTSQTEFLLSILRKIFKGKFKMYGEQTVSGIREVLSRGYYIEREQKWLMSIREDYMITFFNHPM